MLTAISEVARMEEALAKPTNATNFAVPFLVDRRTTEGAVFLDNHFAIRASASRNTEASAQHANTIVRAVVVARRSFQGKFGAIFSCIARQTSTGAEHTDTMTGALEVVG